VGAPMCVDQWEEGRGDTLLNELDPGQESGDAMEWRDPDPGEGPTYEE
jgi:hypothetical protein